MAKRKKKEEAPKFKVCIYEGCVYEGQVKCRVAGLEVYGVMWCGKYLRKAE